MDPFDEEVGADDHSPSGTDREYGGIVDDYASDGIKADFGVPIPSTTAEAVASDAKNAVACSLDMGKRVEELNARWEKEGLPTARLRVGIATGNVIIGCVGSEERLKYTCIGDTINTAARIEGFDKQGFATEPDVSFRVLVGAYTKECLGEHFRIDFLGDHSLDGKSHRTSIYRVWEDVDQDSRTT